MAVDYAAVKARAQAAMKAALNDPNSGISLSSPKTSNSSSSSNASYSTPSSYSAPSSASSSSQGAIPSDLSAIAGMGSMYKNLAGTNYYSTNPGNMHAAYYNADGTPVAHVGYAGNGENYDAFTSNDVFNNIIGQKDATKQYGYLKQLAGSGQLQSFDSIASMSKDPNYGLKGYSSNQSIPNAVTQGMAASTAGTTGSGGAIPQALTASQQSAQDYITKAGKWGTVNDYVSNNINRYNNGEINYDALLKDSQRVGYAIPPQASAGGGGTTSGGNNVTQSGGYFPTQSGQGYQDIAAAEAARDLAGKQRVAGQQITGITNAFNRSNEILKGNRVLEDVSLNNTLNPFSGRTSYAKGLVGRERTLADESAQGNFNTAIQGIQQGLADDQNTASQWIMARAAELESQAQQRAMQEAQLTGVYKGQSTIAAQQMALDQAQREWENKFAYGQSTGMFSNGQKTLDMKRFEEDKKQYGEEVAYKKARDEIADAQEKARLDEDVRQFGISAGIQRYNAETNRMQENRIGSESSSTSSGKEPSATEIRNTLEADLSTLSSAERKDALLGEKDAIIRQFGQTYYDKLFKYYFPNG